MRRFATGAIRGGNQPFIYDPNFNGTVARYALSWLKVHVSDDNRYAQFLVANPAEFSRFEN